MKAFDLSYKPFGENGILIEWPQEINENILKDVLRFNELIKSVYKGPNMVINHAYSSLLILYLKHQFDFDSEMKKLQKLYHDVSIESQTNSTLWKIPVSYESEFAWDIEDMAVSKNTTVDRLIEWHTNAIYTIYFIGFLPGFLYLGGLNPQLNMPRKSSPRLNVPKGAVAIGGNQTGVYPCESPGGWNIIGNSPIEFFNVEKKPPCFAKAGDRLQFYEVSKEKFEDIKVLTEANVYQIESEEFHD